jgi:hypothetical protein
MTFIVDAGYPTSKIIRAGMNKSKILYPRADIGMGVKRY